MNSSYLFGENEALVFLQNLHNNFSINKKRQPKLGKIRFFTQFFQLMKYRFYYFSKIREVINPNFFYQTKNQTRKLNEFGFLLFNRYI
ncbi:hypothetical protein C6W19_04480 [Bacillus sp. RJGP41]|nr:hypothetical protein C6W19_04480 [Bacillus sp. RJGP41]